MSPFSQQRPRRRRTSPGGAIVRRVRNPGRVAACALALGAIAVGPALAAVRAPSPTPGSSLLWATINVCNTKDHPETIGIRGSMPGTGDAQESMFMKFRVEYLRNLSWTNIGSSGESPFEAVGSAASRARQAGVDFKINASTRRHYLLRGVVTFQWRLHDRTVATTLRSTTTGHSVAAGADPPGYSASVCSLAANRRGSFVITPVTPRAASAAIVGRSSTVHA
jgi:hypothetical protein